MNGRTKLTYFAIIVARARRFPVQSFPCLFMKQLYTVPTFGNDVTMELITRATVRP